MLEYLLLLMCFNPMKNFQPCTFHNHIQCHIETSSNKLLLTVPWNLKLHWLLHCSMYLFKDKKTAKWSWGMSTPLVPVSTKCIFAPVFYPNPMKLSIDHAQRAHRKNSFSIQLFSSKLLPHRPNQIQEEVGLPIATLLTMAEEKQILAVADNPVIHLSRIEGCHGQYLLTFLK